MDPLRLGLTSARGVWFGVLVDNQDRLVASAFYSNRGSLEKYLTNRASRLTGTSPVEERHKLAEEMAALFEGAGSSSDTALAKETISTFQNSVYEILSRVPKGSVTTYGRIADLMGSGPRAVGTAVASNPWPLFVPCHRVIPAGLNVGNYSMNGKSNEESSGVKKEILEREGVKFQEDRVSHVSLWRPREA